MDCSGGPQPRTPRTPSVTLVTTSCDRDIIRYNSTSITTIHVAASLGRESITVVTSDKDLLRESVARSVARQSASELSRKAQGTFLERGNA
jgi:hypothetical protein